MRNLFVGVGWVLFISNIVTGAMLIHLGKFPFAAIIGVVAAMVPLSLYGWKFERMK